MKELLKPSDIAPLLGVTPARVYQLIDSGRLPFVRIGRGIRIPRDAWDAWIADQSAKATANIKENGANDNDNRIR